LKSVKNLSPVHTSDYSRRKRRLSPKTATVADFSDKLSPNSATTVASVDRTLLCTQQQNACKHTCYT